MSYMIALSGAQQALAGLLLPAGATLTSTSQTLLPPKWQKLGAQMHQDLGVLRQLETEVLDRFDLGDPHSKRWRDLLGQLYPVADREQHNYYIATHPDFIDRIEPGDLSARPPSIMAPHHLIGALGWKWLGHLKKKGVSVVGRSEWETYKPARMFMLSAHHFMKAAELYEDMGHDDVAVELYLESARLTEQSNLRFHRLQESDGNEAFDRSEDLLKGYLYAHRIFNEKLHDARQALRTAITYVGAFIWTGWNPEISMRYLRNPEKKYTDPLALQMTLPIGPVGIYNGLLNFLNRANDTFIDSLYFGEPFDNTLDTEGAMLLRQVETLQSAIEKEKEAAKS